MVGMLCACAVLRHKKQAHEDACNFHICIPMKCVILAVTSDRLHHPLEL